MASDGEVSCTNDPNFAVICSFLKVFGELYSIEVPSLQKLQELIENTQEGKQYLLKSIITLLSIYMFNYLFSLCIYSVGSPTRLAYTISTASIKICTEPQMGKGCY